MKYKINTIKTDILIIGAGAAGCFSALTLKDKNVDIVIAEKANINRSGCLAAGVNALNAYINEGETVDSYVEYVKREFSNIVREDLLYSIAKGLNDATKKIEDLGLTILKDDKGNYIKRGKRSIKINGENIKPILGQAVLKNKNAKVINNLNIVDYLLQGEEIIGAIGFSTKKEEIFVIYAKSVICSTGGASGIYKPNNPGFSRHKMWYSPFNTGAGYAMGIRAGVEMTTFEMRFIALRCKDTIAPTGTIAQGIKAIQINSKGEDYVGSYGGKSTIHRLYSTVEENKNGKGPCYLKTEGIRGDVEEDLFKAYLNMAPSQALKWIENKGPSIKNVEIYGTEPYIVGGHSASGYWIDKCRQTTLKGLFAAGDVAGGSPKKYVTGAFVEGEIAAKSALTYIKNKEISCLSQECISKKVKNIVKYLDNDKKTTFTIEEIEEAMQKVMDEYAGGISTFYKYNLSKLNIAKENIEKLLSLTDSLKAKDFYELKLIHEVIDRLYVSLVLIEHLKARKETRWRIYGENADYSEMNKSYDKYINSVYKDKQVRIIYRDLISKEEEYEHNYK